MSSPTEHKTVQARILAYAEAIGWTLVSEEKKVIGDLRLEIGEGKKRRGIGDLKLECGVSVSEFYTGEATSWHGRRQIGDRREDFDSESLSSLRSLRLPISDFRVLNHRERRDRREDFNRAIWRQVVAKSADPKFSRRLRENRPLASEHFCNSLLQNSHIV